MLEAEVRKDLKECFEIGLKHAVENYESLAIIGRIRDYPIVLAEAALDREVAREKAEIERLKSILGRVKKEGWATAERENAELTQEVVECVRGLLEGMQEDWEQLYDIGLAYQLGVNVTPVCGIVFDEVEKDVLRCREVLGKAGVELEEWEDRPRMRYTCLRSGDVMWEGEVSGIGWERRFYGVD